MRLLGLWALRKHKHYLSMFDALTGCDTVLWFAFARHWQNAAWTVWTALPEVTRHSLFCPLYQIILMKMPCTPTVLPGQAPQPISTRHAANYLQRKATSSCSQRQSAALEQHVWQAVYQGVHVWVRHRHCHHRPTKVAWRPEACINLSGQCYLKHPWICRVLVSCNYKEGCMKKCKCKNARLECWMHPLCACNGGCSQNWTPTLKTKILNFSIQYTGSKLI